MTVYIMAINNKQENIKLALTGAKNKISTFPTVMPLCGEK
jgi:hypothetical protein